MQQNSYKIMRVCVWKIINGLADDKLRMLTEKCFFSTLDTTVKDSEGMPFVFTGDIPAMWLRDSAAQVLHYLPFARYDGEVSAFVRGLLRRQFSFIRLDPYANAFNAEPNGAGHTSDICDRRSPWVWERKFELDSLCYPFWLAHEYTKATDDESIYGEEYERAAQAALAVMQTEQHPEHSPYRHERYGKGAHITDTLINGGKGPVCGYTGMVRSGYRPSDDACVYGFNIPENMFAAVTLGRMANSLKNIELKNIAARLRSEILHGIETYGILCENGESFYAYEADGLGNALFMDDANVPSLLAAPFMGFCAADNAMYLRTRSRILSHRNPYWFEGTAANGVGSPHTPDGYVWHIGLCVQALTAVDSDEKRNLLQTLQNTDADTGQMHEGFCADDPQKFTRPWFAWANSMFALLVMRAIEEGLL